MRLEFCVPDREHNLFFSDLIVGWLRYNRVFIREDMLDVTYNKTYQMYDCFLKRTTESEKEWQKLEDDLKDVLPIEKMYYSWHNTDGKHRDAYRWIIRANDKDDSLKMNNLDARNNA